MKIVVTGGSGQLGSRVLGRLARDRRVKGITSIDLRPPAIASPKIRAVTADVRDRDIERHLAEHDALVHLAFVVTGARPRAEFDAINVGGSSNVFSAAARAGIARIVYSSSIAAYGVVPGHPEPITEDAPRVHQPGFAYAATKFEVEAWLDTFEKEQPNVAVVRLRPAILVGQDMDHALGDALRRGRLLDGEAPLPIVWDEDVADAVALAIFQEVRGAFNLAAAESLPPRELAAQTGLGLLRIPPSMLRGVTTAANALARAGVGREMDRAWLESSGVRMIISSEKARSVLGWKPRCPTSVDVIRRHRAEVPRRLDPRLALFFRAVTRASQQRPPDDTRGADVLFHLRLTGPDGGDFTIDYQRGRVHARRGIPRPPQAAVTLSTDAFRRLLSGRSDLTTAQLTGEVRQEGNPAASMVLGGILAGFRALGGQPGWRGKVASRFVGWLSNPRGARQAAVRG